MRVVLDEGVPRHLARALRTRHVDVDEFDRVWRGQSNGALLDLAQAAGYDVLLTNDKNISTQQSLRGRSITIVALPLNRRSAILSRVDDIVDTLVQAKPGHHVTIGLDGSRVSRAVIGGRTIIERMSAVPPFRI